MSISINGTNGLTFNDGSSQQTAASGFGFKNRIINGDMKIDQRNAGASVATSSGINGYTIDRWWVQYSATSKFTVQQNAGAVTPPAGYVNYLGVTSSSAYSVAAGDYFSIQQKVEGLNIADLAWGTASAATVTLSFWVRSSLTGTFGGALLNQANTRSYPFSYTISSANTWEQKSITITGDTTGTWLTTNGIGLRVNFALGYGSTYGNGTAGAWVGSDLESVTGATSVVGTNGATFYITGVQLEKGSTATSFDYRPYGTELQLCKRYFESWGSDHPITLPQNYSATIDRAPGCQWEVEKRATPSVTFSSSTAALFGQQIGGNAVSISDISAATPTVWGLGYIGISHASTSGLNRYNVASGQYIWISAEL